MRIIDADALNEYLGHAEIEATKNRKYVFASALNTIRANLANAPTIELQIIHCKDCKHWKQQTNYAGASLSFGFCESDEMWRSLYGETYEVSHIDTDDDFYCGYAERKNQNEIHN